MLIDMKKRSIEDDHDYNNNNNNNNNNNINSQNLNRTSGPEGKKKLFMI